MNVGTSSGGRFGYIRQKPTSSRNTRASSMRPDGLAIETPFFAAELLEFEVSHRDSYQLSALSYQVTTF